MIGFIEGTVRVKKNGRMIVKVPAGVGYDVQCPAHLLQDTEVGEEVALHVVTRVSETDIALFGFDREEDSDLFVKLCSVQGIGGKVGLSLIGDVGYERFCRAVVEEDAKTICRADGVGKKVAQRIIMGMADYVAETFQYDAEASVDLETKTQTMTALEKMGVPPKQASDLIDGVIAEFGAELNTQQMLSQSLKRFRSPAH